MQWENEHIEEETGWKSDEQQLYTVDRAAILARSPPVACPVCVHCQAE